MRFCKRTRSYETLRTKLLSNRARTYRSELRSSNTGQSARACTRHTRASPRPEALFEDFGQSPAIDTGLVAATQAVEHYEMARYGALIAWAGQLKMPDAAALLNETLQEEMKAERLLTQIGANKAVKIAAAKMAASRARMRQLARLWANSRL